jgi:hypothetical protein
MVLIVLRTLITDLSVLRTTIYPRTNCSDCSQDHNHPHGHHDPECPQGLNYPQDLVGPDGPYGPGCPQDPNCPYDLDGYWLMDLMAGP